MIEDNVVLCFFVLFETRVDSMVLTFKFWKRVEGGKTICIISLFHLFRESVVIQGVLFSFKVRGVVE